MPRHPVHPDARPVQLRDRGGGARTVRPPAARRGVRVLRIVVAPFAAVAAAIAGLAYVLLLPICGIASIASAVARASWAALRETFRGARERTAPRS